MRKATFNVQTWTSYENVPIPDELKTSKEILYYLADRIDKTGFMEKYVVNTELQYNTNEYPIYQAIIADENGNETTVCLDD